MTDGAPQYTPQHKRAKHRPGRSAIWAAVIVLVVVVAAIAGAVWYELFKPTTVVAAGKPVQITISKGSSTTQIAEQLARRGVVANPLMFRIQARSAHTDSGLKAGTYAFTTGMGYDAVLAKLNKGPDIIYYTVPIPEGFTLDQIAKRLQARANIPADDFLHYAHGQGITEFYSAHLYLEQAYGLSMEGYLFPATYTIKKGTSAKQVVEMMLDKFDAETAGLDLRYARAHGLTLANVVTLASIIDREVNLKRQYPLVASVIYNRLKANMRLQLDSTVFYTLPDGTKVLTSADLHSQNPYNTYAHKGLPPGPLGNPGLPEMQAAAHPAKTKYYYYVLTRKDGTQTFATNYTDFLKAVKIYHKVFGR